EGVEKVINKLEVVAPEPEMPQFEAMTAQQDEQVAPAAVQAPVRRAPAVPPQAKPAQQAQRSNMPVPYAMSGQGGVQPVSYGYCPPGSEGTMGMGPAFGGPQPMSMGHVPSAPGRTVSYDNPQMPGYAWPSYAAYPNYAALTYPTQYSPSAWPYIGP